MLLTLDKLLQQSPYSLSDSKKNELLLHLVTPQLHQAVRYNRFISKLFATKKFKPNEMASLEEIPFIPATMFKYFDLKTCHQKEITKMIMSSGTTSSIPSRVPLNTRTAFNQMRALQITLEHYLTFKRPLLVIDYQGDSSATEINTRTAAIRGLSVFSQETLYLLKQTNDKISLNETVIPKLKKFTHTPIYILGFTYIIWSIFLKLITQQKLKMQFNHSLIFHTGGWKKLTESHISSTQFDRKLAKTFGVSPASIRNFYGMAEQTGVIFIDCEYGYKHVPNFAQIIIRNPYTLKPCPINQPGLIEILSVLGDSYYSQAVLTEDVGIIKGIDNCRCGRQGKYFTVMSRAESAELRGCGDTFQEKI